VPPTNASQTSWFADEADTYDFVSDSGRQEYVFDPDRHWCINGPGDSNCSNPSFWQPTVINVGPTLRGTFEIYDPCAMKAVKIKGRAEIRRRSKPGAPWNWEALHAGDAIQDGEQVKVAPRGELVIEGQGGNVRLTFEGGTQWRLGASPPGKCTKEDETGLMMRTGTVLEDLFKSKTGLAPPVETEETITTPAPAANHDAVGRATRRTETRRWRITRVARQHQTVSTAITTAIRVRARRGHRILLARPGERVIGGRNGLRLVRRGTCGRAARALHTAVGRRAC
jgi:hypothetical protein